jgi:hypothetical protein
LRGGRVSALAGDQRRCSGAHGGAPSLLTEAMQLEGSRARFSMGFGPTGSGRRGELILLTTRMPRAAVRAGNGGVCSSRFTIDERLLWWLAHNGECSKRCHRVHAVLDKASVGAEERWSGAMMGASSSKVCATGERNGGHAGSYL